MASRLQDVILRGTSAAKPFASAVAPGTLYFSTNTLTTERSNGTIWETYTDGGAAGSGISQLTGDVLAGPGNGSQVATLSATGATAGSYTNANIIVDAKGRILSVSSGLAGAAHAATHASGGTDPVTLAQSQIINLVSDLAGKASTTDPRFTQITAIGCQWDGGGAVPTVGIIRYIEVPFAHTITGAVILSDVSGSAVVDVWRTTYAGAPPTVANTVCASAKPTLSSASKNKDTTLTGWSKSGAAGDVYGFKLDSASVLTFVRVSLTVTRT